MEEVNGFLPVDVEVQHKSKCGKINLIHHNMQKGGGVKVEGYRHRRIYFTDRLIYLGN